MIVSSRPARPAEGRTAPEKPLYVEYRGRVCWQEWHHAIDVAHRRAAHFGLRQRVKAVQVPGHTRPFWAVRPQVRA